jgi:hypothetical protein
MQCILSEHTVLTHKAYSYPESSHLSLSDFALAAFFRWHLSDLRRTFKQQRRNFMSSPTSSHVIRLCHQLSLTSSKRFASIPVCPPQRYHYHSPPWVIRSSKALSEADDYIAFINGLTKSTTLVRVLPISFFGRSCTHQLKSSKIEDRLL